MQVVGWQHSFGTQSLSLWHSTLPALLINNTTATATTIKIKAKTPIFMDF
jgi:hypothetical protein